MKILSVFFFLSSFFAASPTSEMAPLSGQQADLSIIGASASGLCEETATWQVYVCNNSPSAILSTTVEVLMQFCPSDGDVITVPVNNLPPQTCTFVSGTIANPCNCVFIRATVDPQNLIRETNENNNEGSGGDCC